MDLFYYKSPAGNFGDDLNEWLWDEILPDWRQIAPDRLLVGVGTILDARLPDNVCKTVVGSGVGYGHPPDLSREDEWDIRAVRGPLSAKALGLPPETAIIDPAVLIADLPAFTDAPRRQRPVFVPHHRSLRLHDWESVCDRIGLDHVSPERDARDVIRCIAGAPLVVAESMHAAILADAFRVPWTAVSIGPHFNAFKWQDWAASLDIDLRIHPLFPELSALAALLPRRKRTPPSSAPAAPQVPASGPSPPALRRSLRAALGRKLVRRNLRRIAQGPTQQSDADLLERRKAQLRAVLANLSTSARQ